MNIIRYTPEEFDYDVERLAKLVKDSNEKYDSIAGVTRGGVNVAIALSNRLHLKLIDVNKLESNQTTLVVDDIVDSGKTRERYKAWDFACLHYKNETPVNGNAFYYVNDHQNGSWIEYFWEKNEQPAEENVVRLLQMIGEDPNREGLVETPKRFIKAYKHLFKGYNENISDIIKTFTEDDCDEMVILKDIEIYSMCEHHMLPFFGKAHVAYIPNGKVIGVSKLARIVDMYSRRLQIQERIGKQVTSALMMHLNAKGAACIIEAKHMCMTMRGVEKQHSVMKTSSIAGVFKEETNKGIAARNELMLMIK